MKRIIIVLLGVLCIAACGKKETTDAQVTLAEPAACEAVHAPPNLRVQISWNMKLKPLKLRMPAKIIKMQKCACKSTASIRVIQK
jgi:hypothetical protein